MEGLPWLVLALLFACTLIQAEVVSFHPCSEASVCSVSEVRIDPCEKKKKWTVITKGVNTSLSFDFTPNFAATSLKSGLFWVDGGREVEFDALTNADSCPSLTSCPTEPGKTQTLNYILYVGKKLPKGRFTFEWKSWNEADPSQVCCFTTTIKLK